MSTKRKQHSAEFKFKVALEAAKNVKMRAEIASEYGVSGTQVSQWKKELIDKSIMGKGSSSARTVKNPELKKIKKRNYMNKSGV